MVKPFIKDSYKQKAQTTIPAQRRSDLRSEHRNTEPATGRMLHTSGGDPNKDLKAGIFINPGAPLTPFS